MIQHRFFWSAVATGLALILVALGLTWTFGGYEGLSPVGGVALTLGIAVTMAVGVGLMAIIVYGRRSRRDQAVSRRGRAGG